jgi:hypothetical protein
MLGVLALTAIASTALAAPPARADRPGVGTPWVASVGDSYARMLESFARTHNVKLVPLSIGGNNFNFGDIVTQCVKDFLASSYFNRPTARTTQA